MNSFEAFTDEMINKYQNFLKTVDEYLINANVSIMIGYRGQLVQKMQDDMAEFLLIVASIDADPDAQRIYLIKRILGPNYRLTDFKIRSTSRMCDYEDIFYPTDLPKCIAGLAQVGIHNRYDIDEAYFCSTYYSFMNVFGKIIAFSDYRVTQDEVKVFYAHTNNVLRWVKSTFPNARPEDYLPIPLSTTTSIRTLFA